MKRGQCKALIFLFHSGISLTPFVFKDTKTMSNEHKNSTVKKEKEQSFQISIRSWYTPEHHSPGNQWPVIRCVTTICAIHVNTSSICLKSRAIFRMKPYLQCSPTYPPVSFASYFLPILIQNRELRSILVISLRGIGGSKKSRLLLSSKRPT